MCQEETGFLLMKIMLYPMGSMIYFSDKMAKEDGTFILPILGTVTKKEENTKRLLQRFFFKKISLLLCSFDALKVLA
jgi:hypothetical protein